MSKFALTLISKGDTIATAHKLTQFMDLEISAPNMEAARKKAGALADWHGLDLAILIKLN